MKNLLNSKWTAIYTKNKEKHFVVVSIKNKNELTLENIISKNIKEITMEELKSNLNWIRGWK